MFDFGLDGKIKKYIYEVHVESECNNVGQPDHVESIYFSSYEKASEYVSKYPQGRFENSRSKISIIKHEIED